MQCEVAAALGLRERRRWHSADDFPRSFTHSSVPPVLQVRYLPPAHGGCCLRPRRSKYPPANSALSLNAQMRQADDDDEGIEMGGTLDPEDGLQGIASKARPMPKW